MASFIDLFTATDSDGARAARYRVVYEGSVWSNQDSWIFGMFTALLYTVFKVVAVAANGLLGMVLASGSWLDPLSEAYRKFTEPFYRIVPPWVIACAGLAVVVVSVWRSKPKATSQGLMNSESLNRIGVALALMFMVIILTHNPFALLTKVLEVANGFSVGLSSAVTDSTNSTTITAGQALVDNSIRTPTIALNYGNEFSEACKTAWSQAMTSGTELSKDSGCFTEGQNHAGPDTVITAFIMLIFPALPMLVFSVIAAWKYVLHLTMSTLCTVAAAWVAAGSIHKRRGFEQLAEIFARAASHLAMAVVTSMVAVALPTTVAGLATQLLGLVSDDAQTQAFVMMLSLGVGFIVSSWAIYRITSNHGLLVRYLKANANITMESTLGMSPVKLSNITNKYSKWHKVKEQYDKEMETEAKKALAAEAADKPKPKVASSTTLKQKGAAVVPQVSEEDAAAVTQLTQPAESVANAATEQQDTAPAMVAVPDPIPDANRAWVQALGAGQLSPNGQPAPTTTDATTPADTFGFYTKTVVQSAAAQDGDEAAQEEPEVTGSEQPFAAGNTGTPEPAAAVAGAVSGSSPDQNRITENVSPGGSALIPVPDTPIVPVLGNMTADPALNEAALAAGATLDVPAAAPTPQRTLSHGSHFNSDVPAEHVPFSGATIEQGAALTIATGDEAEAQGGDGADDSGDDELNDQQRWNQRGRQFFSRGQDGEEGEESDAESSDFDSALPPSGIGRGPNPNPAAFQAPMEDFLAGAQVEADLELAAVTLAAAGKHPRVTLSPEDSRVSLRLTSDPDRRVEKGGGRGFGDPT